MTLLRRLLSLGLLAAIVAVGFGNAPAEAYSLNVRHVLLGGHKGPTSSDVDVSNWIAAVGKGNTSKAEVAALTTFVAGLKADLGITVLSQKFDRLWVYALGKPAAATVDLVARTSHTLASSPTFTALGGYTGNGSSSFINTNFNPLTNGVRYTQNDASFGVDIAVADSRGSGSFYAYAGSVTTSKSTTIDRNSNNTQWNWGVNNTSTSENTNFGGGLQTGIVMVERTTSAGGGSEIYQAGAAVAAGANASGTMTSQPFFVLAGNNGSGASNQWTNGRVRGFFAGGSLGATGQTNFNTRWAALKTALGAL